MSPKFKGDSEDWLDEESLSAKRQGFKSKTVGAAGPQRIWLDPGETNGTVVEVFPKQCRVSYEGREIACTYSRGKIFGRDAQDSLRERAPVAVGDRVQVRMLSPDSGVIDGIGIRSNSLARAAPGGKDDASARHKQHTIVANVDLLLVVTSAKDPAFTSGVVDRYLVAAFCGGVPAEIALTKMDRVGGVVPPEVAYYQQLGYRVHPLSSTDGTGVDVLRKSLDQRTVAFCGHSGVGKTSLINLLLSRAQGLGRVGEVNTATGKGRHTTTSAIMMEGPRGAHWIDTPGVREFTLAGHPAEMIAEAFPEFRGLACSARGCLHGRDVAECDARDLPRYPSYLSLIG